MGLNDIATAPRLRLALASPWPYFTAVLSVSWALVIWHHLGSHSSAHSGAWTLTFAAWALMTVAMMAPTAVPMMISLRDVLGTTSLRPWWAFLAGYLVVWIGFAAAATTAQMWLLHAELVSLDGSSNSYLFAAGLLVVAGVYQFSALKHRCFTQCVAPMTFFLRHWRDGTQGGIRMGLRHGVSCLGCCWALMSLAFVGGLANVWFMVLCAAVMATEKLPSIGRFVTAPLGVALVTAGLIVIAIGSSGGAPRAPHRHQSLERREIHEHMVNRG